MGLFTRYSQVCVDKLGINAVISRSIILKRALRILLQPAHGRYGHWTVTDLAEQRGTVRR